MKKWMMPIGLIVAICILTASVAMPICLADGNRIEIEGKNYRHEINRYKMGELHRGEKVKIVITDLRGNAPLQAELWGSRMGYAGMPSMEFSHLFDFPGEKIFTVQRDDAYDLRISPAHVRGRGDPSHNFVIYKGYVEW